MAPSLHSLSQRFFFQAPPEKSTEIAASLGRRCWNALHCKCCFGIASAVVVTKLTFTHRIKYIKIWFIHQVDASLCTSKNLHVMSALPKAFPICWGPGSAADLPPATMSIEKLRNEGKNPTARWSNRFFPIVGDVSVIWWMNCQTLSHLNLNAGLCSIVHGLKVSQTTIALVACQSASNIFRILLHRVAAMSKL